MVKFLLLLFLIPIVALSEPPTIADITTSAIKETSAEIVWITKSPTNSKIEINGIIKQDLNTFGFQHAETISNLTPNTSYTYKVTSTDRNGESVISSLQTFKTRAEPSTKYYVSLLGSDSQNGSEVAPFRTIEKARDFIASKPLPVDGVKVIIRGGRYRVKTTISFKPTTSGKQDAPIIYQAYPGETVILDGGIKIDGVPTTNSKLPVGVLEYNLKAQGITDYGTRANSGALIQTAPSPLNLYFNDKPMILARYPNNTELTISQVPAGSRNTLISNDLRPLSWQFKPSFYAHGAWKFYYRDTHLKIESLSNSNGKSLVKFSEPGDPTQQFEAGRYFYYENILEELDSPQEWYLDVDTGILYFYPPSQGDAFVTIIDNGIIFEPGSHDIVFKNITLEHFRNRPVSILQNAYNISIENSNIRLSSQGVMLRGNNSGVYGSELSYFENTAIIQTGGDIKTLTPSFNYVTNNIIHDFGMKNRGYRTGVNTGGAFDSWVSKGVGSRIRNNIIYNGNHTAIVFKGNNHLIDRNEIYNVCNRARDAGAIYTFFGWADRGTLIRYNYIHDVKGEPLNPIDVNNDFKISMIYLDGDQDGIFVYSNILNRSEIGLFLNGGRENVFKNNFVVNMSIKPLYMLAPGLTWMSSLYKIPLSLVTDTTPIEIVTSRPHHFGNENIINNIPNFEVSEVKGQLGANGTWPSKILAYNRIRLEGTVSNGAYSGGGLLLQNRILYNEIEAVNYKNPPYSVYYPELPKHDIPIDVTPIKDEIDTNIIYNNKIQDISKMYQYTSPDPTLNAATYIKPVNNFMTDPKFVDFANDNFRLMPNSPAYDIGVKEIPINEIGLIKEVPIAPKLPIIKVQNE